MPVRQAEISIDRVPRNGDEEGADVPTHIFFILFHQTSRVAGVRTSNTTPRILFGSPPPLTIGLKNPTAIRPYFHFHFHHESLTPWGSGAPFRRSGAPTALERSRRSEAEVSASRAVAVAQQAPERPTRSRLESGWRPLAPERLRRIFFLKLIYLSSARARPLVPPPHNYAIFPPFFRKMARLRSAPAKRPAPERHGRSRPGRSRALRSG